MKMVIDVGYLQEVGWREQGAGMLGLNGRRYKLWRSGKGDGVGSVGVMVKEELCEMVAEVRRVSDDCCCFLCGCAEVYLWVCSVRWMKI